MMSPRLIKIIAVVFILIAGIATALGWELALERNFTDTLFSKFIE